MVLGLLTLTPLYKNRIWNICPLLFEFGIQNVLCGTFLYCGVAYCSRVKCDFDLWPQF